MEKRISPARSVSGSICLPGDKSISHRYAMIAAIAEGETRISNYSTGADCHSTLGCLRGARGGDRRARDRRGGARQGARRAARAGGGSGRGQLRLHHPHALRHPGRAAVPEPDRRGRIAFTPADGAHHEAAGARWALRSRRGTGSSRRSKSRGRRCARSITRCRWRARR